MYVLERGEKKWLFAVNVYIKKYALLGSSKEIVAPNLAKTSSVGSRSVMNVRFL
jgi:hypothetical protein